MRRSKPKLIERACTGCGAVRLVENRAGRQKMCLQCRRRKEHNPMFRGIGTVIACIDCGKERKWWPRAEIATPKRCRPCNVARYQAECNPHWKGGVTSINQRERRTKRYAEWRKAVFERDSYTCVLCFQRGGTLNADHILAFAAHPQARYDVDNGRTLCLACHMATPSYLGGATKLARAAANKTPMLPFLPRDTDPA